MRGQPKLYRYPDGRSPYWFVRFYDGTRTRCISTGCICGKEDDAAQAFLATFILERAKPIARRADELMVAVALEDYYQEHARHKAAPRRVKDAKELLAAHFPGHVANVTRAAVRSYTQQRQKAKFSNGTIRRELGILRAALNHAVKEGRLISVPLVELPPSPPPRQRWLTPEEATRLLDHCFQVHIYAFVMLALHTGQRKGAIENLTWFQVDFRHGIIDFRDPDKETSKRAGVVPMNKAVREMLEDMSTKRKTEFVLEWRGKPAGDIKKLFERTVKMAGLENVSPHTLRHTSATWQAKSGIPMWQIAQVLGHENPLTTAKHYAKFSPDFLRNAVQSVEDVLKSCITTSKEIA